MGLSYPRFKDVMLGEHENNEGGLADLLVEDTNVFGMVGQDQGLDVSQLEVDMGGQVPGNKSTIRPAG